MKKQTTIFLVVLLIGIGHISYAYFYQDMDVFNKNRKIISKGPKISKKLVALTFDDGPDPKYTPAILDLLKKYNAKATFFVTGENATNYKNIIKRIIKEGHEIENHTNTHPNLLEMDEISTEIEILKAQNIIQKFTGKKPIYFRPPKKLYKKETLEIAKKHGYETVLWDLCVENKQSKTPKAMAERIIQNAREGIILLAHDGRLDRTKTIQALPLILQAYKEKGYEFVTLEELLKQDN